MQAGPDEFHLIRLKDLINKLRVLSDECAGNRNGEDSIISDFIGKLLAIPDEIPVFIENQLYYFKLLANVKQLHGYISKDKIQVLSANLRSGQGKVNVILSSNATNVEGLDQVFYLLVHLSFLLELYTNHFGTTKSINLHNKAVVASDVLLQILLKEIWISANAVMIKRAYEGICQPKDKSQINIGNLESFSEQFLKSFALVYKEDMEIGDELCFPMGVYQHSMYLSCVKVKDNKVLFRIDNVGFLSSENHDKDADGKIPPYMLDLIDISAIGKWRQYFVDICKIKFLKDEEGIIKGSHARIIYSRKPQNHQDVQMMGYPCLDKQSAENCVTENYFIGMRYRLHNVLNTGDSVLFNWLLDRNVKFLVKERDPSNLFQQCITNRDNLLRALANSYNISELTVSLISQICIMYLQDQFGLLTPLLQGDGAVPISKAYVPLALVRESTQYEQNTSMKNKKNPGGHSKRAEENNIQKQKVMGDSQPIVLEYLFEPIIGEEDKQTVREASSKPIDEKEPKQKVHKAPTRILVEGQPGIGKSVWCQYLANQWGVAQTNSVQDIWNGKFRLVLWISLRNLSGYTSRKYSLAEVLNAEFPQLSGNLTPQAIDSILNHLGLKVLLVLDGFDEAADWYHEVNKEHGHPEKWSFRCQLLRSIVDSAIHTVLLTSRPDFVNAKLRQSFDLRLQICGFTNDNINKYIDLYFDRQKRPQHRDKLREMLNSHQLVKSLSAIPFNLALICLIWGDNSDLTKYLSVTRLYSFVELWLLRRDRYEQLKKSGIVGEGGVYRVVSEDHAKEASFCWEMNDFENDQKIGYANILTLLEELAWYNHCDDKCQGIYISGARVLKLLRKSNVHPDVMLSEIDKLISLEIVAKRYPEKWLRDNEIYFIHTTFQEYFSAKHWVKRFVNTKTKQDAIKQFCKYKYDKRFEVVWKISAGLLSENYTTLVGDYFECWLAAPLEQRGNRQVGLLLSGLEEFNDYSPLFLRFPKLKNIIEQLITETSHFTGLKLNLVLNNSNNSIVFAEKSESLGLWLEELERFKHLPKVSRFVSENYFSAVTESAEKVEKIGLERKLVVEESSAKQENFIKILSDMLSTGHFGGPGLRVDQLFREYDALWNNISVDMQGALIKVLMHSLSSTEIEAQMNAYLLCLRFICLKFADEHMKFLLEKIQEGFYHSKREIRKVLSQNIDVLLWGHLSVDAKHIILKKLISTFDDEDFLVEMACVLAIGNLSWIELDDDMKKLLFKVLEVACDQNHAQVTQIAISVFAKLPWHNLSSMQQEFILNQLMAYFCVHSQAIDVVGDLPWQEMLPEKQELLLAMLVKFSSIEKNIFEIENRNNGLKNSLVRALGKLCQKRLTKELQSTVEKKLIDILRKSCESNIDKHEKLSEVAFFVVFELVCLKITEELRQVVIDLIPHAFDHPSVDVQYKAIKVMGQLSWHNLSETMRACLIDKIRQALRVKNIFTHFDVTDVIFQLPCAKQFTDDLILSLSKLSKSRFAFDDIPNTLYKIRCLSWQSLTSEKERSYCIDVLVRGVLYGLDKDEVSHSIRDFFPHSGTFCDTTQSIRDVATMIIGQLPWQDILIDQQNRILQLVEDALKKDTRNGYLFQVFSPSMLQVVINQDPTPCLCRLLCWYGVKMTLLIKTDAGDYCLHDETGKLLELPKRFTKGMRDAYHLLRQNNSFNKLILGESITPPNSLTVTQSPAHAIGFYADRSQDACDSENHWTNTSIYSKNN